MNDRPEAFAGLEVEREHLIPGDTVQLPVRSKSEVAWLAESGQSVWRKDTNEITRRRMVFPNGGHGIGRAEGIFARNQYVAVRCDGQIERAEAGIFDAPIRQ